MRNFWVITMVLITILHSCSNKENWENGGEIGSTKGAVSLKVSSSGDFITLQTKAESVNVNDFVINIWRGETLYKSFPKYSDIPSVIEIDPGTYTLEAGSKENLEAAFSQPIYNGRKEFTVQAGKVSDVNVVCKLANMKVTIKCNDAFLRELNDDFRFVVRNDKTDYPAFLIFTKTEIQNGISGYFKPAKLTITLQATKRLDNAEVLDTRELATGAAQDHHILNFSIRETGGVEMGSSGILIDYTLNNKNMEIVIPGEDETPVEPEPPVDPPVGEYLPEITGNGIGSVLRLSDAQAADAVVEATVKALNGKTIQSLEVEIRSPYLTEEFLGGVNMPTKFDLANFEENEAGETLKEMLAELGLIDPNVPVKGRASYSFSIGLFMALIESPATGEQQHDFVITVKDSDHKVKNATLSVIRYKGN